MTKSKQELEQYFTDSLEGVAYALNPEEKQKLLTTSFERYFAHQFKDGELYGCAVVFCDDKKLVSLEDMPAAKELFEEVREHVVDCAIIEAMYDEICLYFGKEEHALFRMLNAEDDAKKQQDIVRILKECYEELGAYPEADDEITYTTIRQLRAL